MTVIDLPERQSEKICSASTEGIESPNISRKNVSLVI